MPPVRIVRQSSKYAAGKLSLSTTRVRKSQNIACEFPDCTLTFVQKCNYRDHMNVHEGKRPHACPDCESAFANRGGLTRHQKKYHDYVPAVRTRPAKRKAATTGDDKYSLYDIGAATAPSPPPTAAASSSYTADTSNKPRWIDSFASDEPTSTLPVSGLEPTSNPSEPSTSASESLYASLLSPIFSQGPTSGYTNDYTDCFTLEYPPSPSPPLAASTLHYDYSQPSFADLSPSESSSSTFAPTPDYSYWSSPPIQASQESETFHGNTYNTSGDIQNLDHWYQPQFQLRNTSIPTNFN